MENFTPGSALAGGALIGLAASFLMLSLGRVAGVSGILGGALDPRAERSCAPRGEEDNSYRYYFLGGLVLAGVIAYLVGYLSPQGGTPTLPFAAGAGLLVGAGTQLGSGCTSGHGVCGLSRFSRRSLAATLVF